MKKYVLVEVDIDDNQLSTDNVRVTTKQLTLTELLQDSEFRAELINSGWVNATNIDTLSNGLGPRVFCVSWNKQYPNSITGKLCDSTTKDVYYRNEYYETLIAVEVGLESLNKYNPELYKQLKNQVSKADRAQKAAEVAAEKRKADAEKKRQAKEIKKLEDAKQLLEKNGLKFES
jgi:hypothetical protein